MISAAILALIIISVVTLTGITGGALSLWRNNHTPTGRRLAIAIFSTCVEILFSIVALYWRDSDFAFALIKITGRLIEFAGWLNFLAYLLSRSGNSSNTR